MTTLAEYYQQQGHQEGHQEGHQIGHQIGHQVGRQESQKEIARNLLEMGLGLEGVAQGTGLSLAEVKALQRTCEIDSQKTA